MRFLLYPALNLVRGKPTAALYLVRVQRKRSFMGTLIHPHKLLSGFGASVHFKQPLGGTTQSDPQFLADFPKGTGVVILPSIEVPGG